MMPDEHVAQLRAQLEALADASAELSQHLASASRELAEAGEIPRVELVDELDQVRARFADLRRAWLQLASDVHDDQWQAPTNVTSLSSLDELLRATEEAVERRTAARIRERALALLDQVDRLRHRVDAEFVPLQEYQASARKLRMDISTTDWPAVHPEALALAEGRHPAAYLVELAARQAELDDARWAFLHAALEPVLGKPLTVAAARGKLQLARPTPVASEDAENEDNEDDWPTFTLDNPAPADPAPSAEAPAMPTLAEADEPTSQQDPESLIWQALHRDRPGPAFVLAQCTDAQPPIPRWLLHALALSPHLLHANGDIALQLTDDFAAYAAEQIDASSHARVLKLLVVAAALRPSLVAPDTGAWTLLRKAMPENGLASLYRCSQVIADYGEHHPPLSPHTLAAPMSPSDWRDAMEDLLREIGAWRVRNLGLASVHRQAAQVWREWLRPDGLIHALLSPLTLDAHGLEAARGTLERVSNQEQIRWEIDDTEQRLFGLPAAQSGAPAATIQELVDRIHEAVCYARRWIALQENRPGRADDEPRRLARQLKEQLLQLRPSVAQELDDLQVPTSPEPLQAAVSQCRAALASIDALLGESQAASHWTRTCVEPPPGLILYADLLRLGAPLNADWTPRRLDRSRVLLEAPRLLTVGDASDWQHAFDVHLKQHDHIATAQIIECIQTHGEGAQATIGDLVAARLVDIEECRSRLQQHVVTARARVDLAAAEGRLNQRERAQLLATVEHISLGTPVALRFEVQEARLHHVLEQLDHLPPPDSAVASPEAIPIRDVYTRLGDRCRLWDAHGPLLLCSRPGLGGSDVLRAGAAAVHRPADDHLAVVLDLDQDDAERRSGAARFWELLRSSLTSAGVLAAGEAPANSHTADSSIPMLEHWFSSTPTRRLLLLVQNADSLLQEDAHHGHALGRRLADLVDATTGRFKVVLSGYLGILRVARMADYPLASRGCGVLRALVDHGGWKDAQALLRHHLDPIRPESPAVAARILGLANYEPEAIGQLARLLADATGGSGLTASVVDEVAHSREGKAAMTASLRLACRADARHAAIVRGLVLAALSSRHEIDPPQTLGASRAWLLQQFAASLDSDEAAVDSATTFASALDELVTLGLVIEASPDRFMLGSPNLARVVGSAADFGVNR